jgi:hypothetical protein
MAARTSAIRSASFFHFGGLLDGIPATKPSTRFGVAGADGCGALEFVGSAVRRTRDGNSASNPRVDRILNAREVRFMEISGLNSWGDRRMLNRPRRFHNGKINHDPDRDLFELKKTIERELKSVFAAAKVRPS